MTRWLIVLPIAWVFGTFSARPAQAQWVEPPGTGWAQIEVVHHRTDTRFGPTGSIEPLFNKDSRSLTTSVFTTASIGIVPGLDVWTQVPVHRLQFNDVVDTRTSTGLGDPRFFVRIGPRAVGISTRWPVAVRGGVKLPVGDFPVDAEIIPLTEGQRDWELLIELGRSFHPAPVYVIGWGGYRWREVNPAIDRKPGNEYVVHGAVGGKVGALSWKVAVGGLFGQPPVRRFPSGFDITLTQDVRRLVQLLPTVGWQWGPGSLQIGGRLPIAGRNLPAGPAFTVGYFAAWGTSLW